MLTQHSRRTAEDRLARYNRTDWLDIGYARLGALADYKVELFSIGEGVSPPLLLKDYPRWSASLWDLVARAIAMAQSKDSAAPEERLSPPEVVEKKFARVEELTAILQYLPANGAGARQLGLLEVRRWAAFGVYRATLHEDLRPSLSALPFLFRPRFLRPAELVCRAAVAALTGRIDAFPSAGTEPANARGHWRRASSADTPGQGTGEDGAAALAAPAGRGAERGSWGSPGAVTEARFLQFLEAAL